MNTWLKSIVILLVLIAGPAAADDPLPPISDNREISRLLARTGIPNWNTLPPLHISLPGAATFSFGPSGDSQKMIALFVDRPSCSIRLIGATTEHITESQTRSVIEAVRTGNLPMFRCHAWAIIGDSIHLFSPTQVSAEGNLGVWVRDGQPVNILFFPSEISEEVLSQVVSHASEATLVISLSDGRLAAEFSGETFIVVWRRNEPNTAFHLPLCKNSVVEDALYDKTIFSRHGRSADIANQIVQRTSEVDLLAYAICREGV